MGVRISNLGNQARLFVARHNKWFSLLLILVFSLLTEYMRISSPLNYLSRFRLDASWWLELGYQLDAGNLLGRDVFYTYGPLSQAIVWLGGWLQGGDFLSAYSMGQFLFEALGLVTLYLAICLIVEIDWSSAILIFAVMYIFNAILVRPLSSLLAVVLVIRALSADSPRRGYAYAALAGLLCFGSQINTIDFGVLAGLASGGLILFYWLLAIVFRGQATIGPLLRTPGAYAKIAGVVFGCYFGLNSLLEIYFKLSAPTYQWFNYWHYGIKIMSGYSYTMGLDWLSDYPDRRPLLTIILFLMVGYSIYVVGLRFKEGLTHSQFSGTYSFIGLLIFATLITKSALTRSDTGHVLYGATGFLFLFSLCLATMRPSRLFTMSGILILITGLNLWPYRNSIDSLQVWPKILRQPTLIGAKWDEIRAITIDPQIFISPGLDEVVGRDTRIVSFPYNNIVAIALGRPSFAPILQTHIAHDTSLQLLYIQELALHLDNLEIIYGLDGPNTRHAFAIDGVQNISRVPVIFEYLAENYTRKVPRNFDGYLVLSRRIQPLPFIRDPLVYTARVESPTVIELQLTDSPDCALLELNLEVGYPLLTLLGRPNSLVIQVRNQGQIVREGNLVTIDAERPFKTFLFLGSLDKFEYLFNLDRSSAPKITFDSLALFAGPTSLFDIQPNSLKIHGLNCIH